MNKYILYIICGFIGLGVAKCIYDFGYSAGYNEATLEYNKKIDKHNQKYEALKADYKVKEDQSRKENLEIALKLNTVKKDYENELNAYRINYNNRLREFNERIKFYERKAKSRGLEPGSDTSYVAKLDRSLIEGRNLVKELSATVRFREDQLKLLGNQIKSDRKLME